MASQIYNNIEDTCNGEHSHSSTNGALTNSIKTTEFELEWNRLTLTEMWLCTKTASIYVKTEHFTLCVKDNDTKKSANIKNFVLQAWHIFTRTRIIAMFRWNCKIARTCDSFHYLMTINLETVQQFMSQKSHVRTILHLRYIAIVRVLVKICQACNTNIYTFLVVVMSLSLTHNVKCSVFT